MNLHPIIPLGNSRSQSVFPEIKKILNDEAKAIRQLRMQAKGIRQSSSASICKLLAPLAETVKNDIEIQKLIVTDLYWNFPDANLRVLSNLFPRVGSIKTLAKHHRHIIPIRCARCDIPINLSPRASYQRKVRLCDRCRAGNSNRRVAIVTTPTAEVERLKSMPYKEYLQTDHWLSLRYQTLKIAGFRCQLCNKSGSLQVHHRTYERRGSEEVSDLISLCPDCHAKFHDKLPAKW